MTEHNQERNKIAVPERNKRLGIFLIVAPFVGLFLIFTFYAITTFVLDQPISATETTGMGLISVVHAQPLTTDNTNYYNPTDETTIDTLPPAFSEEMLGRQDMTTAIGELINVTLGFLGIVFVLWIIFGVPIGIYLVTKKHPSDSVNIEKVKHIPEAIRRWNWGAFFLGWIWGLAHGVWISLVSLIPLVNIPFMFYLGAKGNELAWQNGHWDSIESFYRTQRKWAIAGVIVFTVSLTFGVLSGLADTMSGDSYNSPMDSSDVVGDTATTPSSAKTNEELCWDMNGSHGTYNSLNNSCECADDYYFGAISKQCVSLVTSRDEACESDYPDTSFLKYDETSDTNICDCKAGYFWDDDLTACYSQTSFNQSCANSYGQGSYSATENGSRFCACSNGFAWTPQQDACVTIASINAICERDVGRNSRYAGTSSGETYDCTQPY